MTGTSKRRRPLMWRRPLKWCHPLKWRRRLKWPPPPDRDDLHQHLGQEAASLLAEYRPLRGKTGAKAPRQKWIIKGQALDLLRTTGAPHSLVALFDMMLGGVATKLLTMRPRPPWIDLIVDYEARAAQLEDREVDNAELTDKVVMPNHPELSDRDHVMREVRKVRRAAWYPALIRSRQVYLIDNPQTV